MRISPSVRTLVAVWAAWAIIVIGYQVVATARFRVDRPDYAVSWTANETRATSQDDKPYLLDAFMNQQVSWDSEFYLSIALHGYDDPQVRTTPPPLGRPLSLSYAFLPLYPHVIRFVAVPLQWLGLAPIASATLAGVIVSLLGTLAALLALYDLARETLDENGALRAAFYLIIFPSAFFMAMVYTEGLFAGLAFGSLALIRRKQLALAAVLAALATWTRAVGIGLVIPLGLAWWREANDAGLFPAALPVRTWAGGLLVIAPLKAYLLWRSLLGAQFDEVERIFFGRGLLRVSASMTNWNLAFQSLFGDNSQARVYYAIEFAAILAAFAACLIMLRRQPGVALFGLFVTIISLTSGPAQGMHRYVLAVPSIFMVLARLGAGIAFDRAWTLGSILLMGMMAFLFASDFWAG